MGRPTLLPTKKKVDPKTAQTALRPSNGSLTPNLYAQTGNDELVTKQKLMLDAIFAAEADEAAAAEVAAAAAAAETDAA